MSFGFSPHPNVTFGTFSAYEKNCHKHSPMFEAVAEAWCTSDRQPQAKSDEKKGTGRDKCYKCLPILSPTRQNQLNLNVCDDHSYQRFSSIFKVLLFRSKAVFRAILPFS